MHMPEAQRGSAVAISVPRGMLSSYPLRMIRHRLGDEFVLITQHDHAQLSGKLATRVGNALFSPPSPYQETVDGIALHDCGWPLHDERPTLNPQGQPLHVLESPMTVAIPVWSESVRGAAEKSPYAALLVSLHVLALSALAESRDQAAHERHRDARELFDLNKFQHKQVEHQQTLRRELELRTDIPLRLGLAPRGTGAREDLLLFSYHLLKTMDRISLDVCSGEDLFETIEEVYPRPGGDPVTIRIGHPAHFELTLDPWPFDEPLLRFDLPSRRLPAQKYADDEEFRRDYHAAGVQSVAVTMRQG